MTIQHLAPTGQKHPGPVSACRACTTTTGRGYGTTHQHARAHTTIWPGTLCARCRQPILPGQPWDLDHNDDGTYRGASHVACNRGKR